MSAAPFMYPIKRRQTRVPRVSAIERTFGAGALTVHVEDVCGHCGAKMVRERAPRAIEPEALALVREDLAGADPQCLRFFDVLWSPLPGPQRIRELAALLDTHRQTLTTRFYRAGLPSPKRYMLEATMVRAAHLLAFYPTSSVNAVSRVLNWSSSQSFGRTVRTMTGMTAMQWRAEWDGPARLDYFRETMVHPYREQLLTFRPFVTPHARYDHHASDHFSDCPGADRARRAR